VRLVTYKMTPISSQVMGPRALISRGSESKKY
jgi:hypothetical protein